MKISSVQIRVSIALAILFAVFSCVVFAQSGIDNIADMETCADGTTVVASYDGDTIELVLVDETGSIKQIDSISRSSQKGITSVTDIAVDSQGVIYLLLDHLDELTGEYVSQSLAVYDASKLFQKNIQTLWFGENEGVRYRWLEASTSLTMVSVNDAQTVLYRELYDIDDLAEGVLTQKGSRSYTIPADEGIFEVEPVGTALAYITMSGKVYLAGEDGADAKELYPARILEELMYPTFLAMESDTTLIIGEQESGNFLSLSIEDGTTQTYKNGSEPFSGLSSYSPSDIVSMSMTDLENFTGVVKNDSSGFYELIVSNAGQVSVVTSLKGGIGSVLKQTLWVAFLALLVCLAFFAIWNLILRAIHTSRLIRTKLIFSTLPLLAAAMVVLGYFTYNSYADSIRLSFYKQVEDEGNMLIALFGTESFAEVEFPYDYPDEAYQYLAQQIATRDIYVRTSYFENGTLYTGVDSDYPCFYTSDIYMNADIVALQETAARTGQAQTALVSDVRGERLICITPIGGSDTSIVYLLETGITVENMNSYTRAYILNFALIAFLFMLSVDILLVLAFVKNLQPLQQIKEGIEEFSKGERSVRLDIETNDELSDISRVFNQLAGDVDLQLYELNRLSTVYYRFIPHQMLRLLQKDSIGNIELGSKVEGEYIVLMAALTLSDAHNVSYTQELTNTFFNTIHDICGASSTATLLSDSANLRRLCILCPSGAGEAVEIALSAVAKLDAINATLPIQLQMDVSFVVDKAEIYYGVCGDEARLMPALISNEIDWLAQKEAIFTQMASRLIVTEKAQQEIDLSRFSCRYIGTLNEENREACGLYDFYDSTQSEHTRLINATLPTFQKAMELYEEERYYEAKNLFVLVLRENRFDNVARYYLFECEKHIPTRESSDV